MATTRTETEESNEQSGEKLGFIDCDYYSKYGVKCQ